MSKKLIIWILFISLCIIWGSSFMLMKWGMFDTNKQPILSPYQVAALRMLSSGIIMLPFIKKAWQQIPKKTIRYVILSGWLGSFFPAFLFCIAETKVDGALSGSLNSLTPIFVIIIGALFFKRITLQKRQVLLSLMQYFLWCLVARIKTFLLFHIWNTNHTNWYLKMLTLRISLLTMQM